MSTEGSSFEVGISRHAPKVEKSLEPVNLSAQKVDRESAQNELEPRTRFLLDNLRQAKPGTVMALEPSNVGRAEETRGMLISEMNRLLVGQDNIEMVELGDDELKSGETLGRIKSEPNKKFIISDLRGTWLIGFKEDDKALPTAHKWKKKLNNDENLLGKVWAAREEEIPALVDELKTNGLNVAPDEIIPGEFQITPEEQVLRFVKWMSAMRKIGASHFSGRPLILEGISHNLRSDYATLAFLGEDISVESINRILGGEFRKPYERSSFFFDQKGGTRISYRGIEKEYSAEEFDRVVKGIREKSNERKREWSGESKIIIS